VWDVGCFVARFPRRGVIAGAARDTRHLGARFPRRGVIAGASRGIWRFGARIPRHLGIAGAARGVWLLGARFPRLKPWVYGYVSLFEPVLCEGLYLFCFDDMLIASKIDFNF
jgi:hypothetical protein